MLQGPVKKQHSFLACYRATGGDPERQYGFRASYASSVYMVHGEPDIEQVGTNLRRGRFLKE